MRIPPGILRGIPGYPGIPYTTLVPPYVPGAGQVGLAAWGICLLTMDDKGKCQW